MVGDLRVEVAGGDSSATVSPITLRFAAIGNRALLNRPMVQVQCSRRHFRYRRVAKPGDALKIAMFTND